MKIKRYNSNFVVFLGEGEIAEISTDGDNWNPEYYTEDYLSEDTVYKQVEKEILEDIEYEIDRKLTEEEKEELKEKLTVEINKITDMIENCL